MEVQIKELYSITENLEKLINTIQQNVNFNIGLTWTILGVVTSIIGVAVVLIAKNLFQETVKKELTKYKHEIINEVTNYSIIRTTRCIGSSGIQIVSYSHKAHGLIIKACFEDERRSYNCKFIKDMLMYTENGASHDSIKIICPNGATSEVEVKSSVENGIQLEWTTNGDVEMVNVNLDIMIF